VAVASEYNKYPVEPPAASIGGSAGAVTLRQFALAVHEADGVADACVSLQDELGLDVNVLLLAAYVGAVRGVTLTPAALDSARALTDDWRRDVVYPLRLVRRGLKSGPPPAPSTQTAELRSQVAKAELAAEMIELDVLGEFADDLRTASAPGGPAERAAAAMDVVMRGYQAGSLGDDALRAVELVAAAAARHSKVR
jgi:uncharacterized protein (TIGR02444 family)